MVDIAAGAPQTASRPAGRNWSLLGLHAVILLLCALTLFPFLWMLSTSFKLPNEVFTRDIRLIPNHPTIHNYPDAFKYFPLWHWIWNSFGIGVIITAARLLISIPAAFAFGRLSFKGDKVLFAVVLSTMIVPGVVTIIPNYIRISQWNMINTWQGVILPSIPATAFYMFLLRQNVRTLPQELIDAARVDGASTLKILYQIVIPNIKPTIAVVIVLSFLGAWNQYLWPLLVLNDFNAKTLATGMQYFTANAESAQMWGPMMATAAIAVIPPLVLYALAQRQIIETFVNSGIKG